jgi:hypothetical protein
MKFYINILISIAAIYSSSAFSINTMCIIETSQSNGKVYAREIFTINSESIRHQFIYLDEVRRDENYVVVKVENGSNDLKGYATVMARWEVKDGAVLMTAGLKDGKAYSISQAFINKNNLLSWAKEWECSN